MTGICKTFTYTISFNLYKNSILIEYYYYSHFIHRERTSLIAQLVKDLPAIQETPVPGSGRSPGEGNGNPLQYSCLENYMDKGAWQATVCGVERVGQDLATKLLLLSKMILEKCYFPFPVVSAKGNIA